MNYDVKISPNVSHVSPPSHDRVGAGLAPALAAANRHGERAGFKPAPTGKQTIVHSINSYLIRDNSYPIRI
jgi:hypothetical protein